MKSRTRARELTLQFLYQVDLLGEEKIADLKRFLKEEEPGDKEAREFAQRLVEGTFEKRIELDETIQRIAENWQIARMAVIDRNVLRLATYELVFCQDIPLKVAINEAIELGKRFSTANSGGFINGILDKVRKSSEVQEGRGDDPSTDEEISESDGEQVAH